MLVLQSSGFFAECEHWLLRFAHAYLHTDSHAFCVSQWITNNTAYDFTPGQYNVTCAEFNNDFGNDAKYLDWTVIYSADQHDITVPSGPSGPLMLHQPILGTSYTDGERDLIVLRSMDGHCTAWLCVAAAIVLPDLLLLNSEGCLAQLAFWRSTRQVSVVHTFNLQQHAVSLIAGLSDFKQLPGTPLYCMYICIMLTTLPIPWYAHARRAFCDEHSRVSKCLVQLLRHR